ncbi:MAG TPA: hypothetical protein ENK72_02250 [Epsilonproteobacteria bacterium]|nr:hypothetical protein [Campylobacterota bacterium]
MPDPKMICCFVPYGKGTELLKLLKSEKGIITANNIEARGTSLATRTLGGMQLDTVSLIVEAERADEIFVYIYETMEIAKSHEGMLYQYPLKRASEYSL